MAEDLLKCLKEDLISELLVITTTRNSKKKQISMVVETKRNRFQRNFGKIPRCSFEIISQVPEEVLGGKKKIHR
jgi:hypothetical protein